MRGARARALVVVFSLLIAAASHAEIRRLEVTGAAPAGADAPAGTSARQAALRNALDEGVLRVAYELLGPAAAETPDLPQRLGDGASQYAVRYRILADRGERRALLVADPEVAVEHVIEAEVHVDVDRVRAWLESEGLLVRGPAAPARRYAVAIDGPVPYPVYRTFLDALEQEGRVRSAQTVSLSRGLVELSVESEVPPDELAASLGSRLPTMGVGLETESVDETSLRVRLHAVPTPSTIDMP